MTGHALTAEQLRKFLDATGSARPPQIQSGNYTTAELQKLADSLGGLKNWPILTNDPRVNYVVVCVVALKFGEEEPEFDEKIYTEELKATIDEITKKAIEKTLVT